MSSCNCSKKNRAEGPKLTCHLSGHYLEAKRLEDLHESELTDSDRIELERLGKVIEVDTLARTKGASHE